MGLTFGTGTTVRSFIAYREWLRVAEDCGFALLTTGDSQSLWADPFVSLAVAASETTRPRLGLTVSNPVTRHPAVVASSLAALQDLSGGRVAYGISSGDSALRNIGERPATVDELREFVVALRGLTETGSAVWHGRDLSLRWTTARTPIWLAAEGPRTQRLAGELADGVVLSNCLTAGSGRAGAHEHRRGRPRRRAEPRRPRAVVDGQRRARRDRGRGHRVDPQHPRRHRQPCLPLHARGQGRPRRAPRRARRVAARVRLASPREPRDGRGERGARRQVRPHRVAGAPVDGRGPDRALRGSPARDRRGRRDARDRRAVPARSARLHAPARRTRAPRARNRRRASIVFASFAGVLPR